MHIKRHFFDEDDTVDIFTLIVFSDYEPAVEYCDGYRKYHDDDTGYDQ